MSKTFTVVRILDEYSLIISGGFEEGIFEGDHLQIFSEGTPIYDPNDSSILIGSFDNIKATVIAKQVQEHLTICQNQVILKNMPTIATILNGLSNIESISTTSTLPVDPTQIEPINLDDKIIRLGDSARKITLK